MIILKNRNKKRKYFFKNKKKVKNAVNSKTCRANSDHELNRIYFFSPNLKKVNNVVHGKT
jgi:hypothetical protein